MATSKTSEAKAKVSLDSASFEKGAKAVMDAALAMSVVVKVALASAGAAILAALGAQTISALHNSVKGVIDLGEAMANAAKKTGFAAGQFYLFNAAVEKGLGMKTVAGLIGDNAAVLDRSASVFRDVAIKLWVVGEKIRGFWLGLMDRVAPVLSHILDGALGASLVEAGQWFGDKIAQAVKVVYELAKDGNLWTTLQTGLEIAFDYASDRMLALGKLGGDILTVVVSTALVDGMYDGIENIWGKVVSFCQDFGKLLGDALFDAITDVLELINKGLDAIDAAVKFLNGGNIGDTSKLAEERKQKRDEGIVNRRGTKSSSEPEAPENKKSLANQIEEIFAKFSFNPSKDLAKRIDEFRGTVTTALTGYEDQEKAYPTKTYENNTRRAAFGADSLTAIGGGGGVYLGLSVLDVNKQQLSVLRSIDQRLGSLGTNSSLSITNLQATSADISRAQTSAPVTN